MKYLTFMSLMLCHVLCTGQNAATINEFFAGAYEQPTVLFQNQKIEFLNTISHELPLIEKLEVRTETNEFDFSRQEYLLRVSPNSFKSIQTQQQHQEAVQYMANMELDAALGKAIRGRYNLLVQHIYLQEILNVKNKQKILYNDRATLMKRSISLPDFEILELIEAEDEVEKNSADILDLENAIQTIAYTVQRIDGVHSMPQINMNELLDINGLKKLLPALNPSESFNHPLLSVLSARKYNNMLDYEWEAAKSKFSLGYVQAKYASNSQDNFSQKFSIGIGFDIPLRGAERLDLNELQIKVFESESRYKETREFLLEKRYAQYRQLKNMIQKYDLVSEQLNNSQAEFALEEYSKLAEASPNALLKLRENTLHKELLLQRLQFEIMQTYIEYLDHSGLLTMKPYKNYLLKSQAGF